METNLNNKEVIDIITKHIEADKEYIFIGLDGDSALKLGRVKQAIQMIGSLDYSKAKLIDKLIEQ